MGLWCYSFSWYVSCVFYWCLWISGFLVNFVFGVDGFLVDFVFGMVCCSLGL